EKILDLALRGKIGVADLSNFYYFDWLAFAAAQNDCSAPEMFIKPLFPEARETRDYARTCSGENLTSKQNHILRLMACLSYNFSLGFRLGYENIQYASYCNDSAERRLSAAHPELSITIEEIKNGKIRAGPRALFYLLDKLGIKLYGFNYLGRIILNPACTQEYPTTILHEICSISGFEHERAEEAAFYCLDRALSPKSVPLENNCLIMALAETLGKTRGRIIDDLAGAGLAPEDACGRKLFLGRALKLILRIYGKQVVASVCNFEKLHDNSYAIYNLLLIFNVEGTFKTILLTCLNTVEGAPTISQINWHAEVDPFGSKVKNMKVKDGHSSIYFVIDNILSEATISGLDDDPDAVQELEAQYNEMSRAFNDENISWVFRHDFVSPMTTLKSILDFYIIWNEKNGSIVLLEEEVGIINDMLHNLIDLRGLIDRDFTRDKFMSLRESYFRWENKCFSYIKTLQEIGKRYSEIQQVMRNSAVLIFCVYGSLRDAFSSESYTLENYDLNVVLSDFEIHFGEHVRSIMNYYDGPLYALVDQVDLVRIVYNLFRNARNATASEICLSLSVENDQIILQVTDDGTGILAEKIEHIFEPGVSTGGKGHGYGLAIVKRLVERNGGIISVESRHESEYPIMHGTVFTIRLPLASGTVLKSLTEVSPDSQAQGQFFAGTVPSPKIGDRLKGKPSNSAWALGLGSAFIAGSFLFNYGLIGTVLAVLYFAIGLFLIYKGAGIYCAMVKQYGLHGPPLTAASKLISYLFYPIAKTNRFPDGSSQVKPDAAIEHLTPLLKHLTLNYHEQSHSEGADELTAHMAEVEGLARFALNLDRTFKNPPQYSATGKIISDSLRHFPALMLVGSAFVAAYKAGHLVALGLTSMSEFGFVIMSLIVSYMAFVYLISPFIKKLVTALSDENDPGQKTVSFRDWLNKIWLEIFVPIKYCAFAIAIMYSAGVFAVYCLSFFGMESRDLADVEQLR
ncbi:MAG: ATP-binding protein, partial [Candidatus Omnitrophota bacterium]